MHVKKWVESRLLSVQNHQSRSRSESEALCKWGYIDVKVRLISASSKSIVGEDSRIPGLACLVQHTNMLQVIYSLLITLNKVCALSAVGTFLDKKKINDG